MSHDHCPATPVPTPAPWMLWPDPAKQWGDLSADQADGFAPVDDGELPGPDVNDDHGYGHGV